MTNEANIQIVIEAVDSAVSARFQLSQLLDGVNEAHNQVVHLHYIGSDCVGFVKKNIAVAMPPERYD